MNLTFERRAASRFRHDNNGENTLIDGIKKIQ